MTVQGNGVMCAMKAPRQVRTVKPARPPKGIKVLNKSVEAVKHMKDAVVQTKRAAEGTQDTGKVSPSAYAGDNVSDKAQTVVRETMHGVPGALRKARDNFTRAKNHFREVKRQLPKGRQRMVEQAKNVAAKTKDRAEKLRKTAGNAKDAAVKTKDAVKDAKQTLRKVKQSGRQTLREVKQAARSGNKGIRLSERMRKISGLRPSARANPGGGTTPMRSVGNMSKPLRGQAQAGGKAVESTMKTATRTTTKAASKTANPARRTAKQTAKGTIKTAKKTVKTAERAAKQAVKTAQRSAKVAQKTAQATVKAAKVAERTARAAAKTAVQTARMAARVTIATVKAAIAAVKGLVSLIAAGGWIAVFMILMVCLVGLFVGSTFGIFFSNEPNPSTGQTINTVIAEINTEYTAQIDGILAANMYDLLDMSGTRAAWREVLAVYTVRTVSDPANPMDVATMDDAKAAILRTVFEDMNSISHTLDVVDVAVDILDTNGVPTGETTILAKAVLRIVVSHKTPEEMAALYGFSDEQREWLAELLKPDYHHMWNALLYGVSGVGDMTMIAIAETQIGNIGGEPYWSWYGFTNYVKWCACFVSWCAEQCGYIDAGIIPRFALCEDGMNWFKRNGQWQDGGLQGGYTPAPGDIIFFNWNDNPDSDHVGIVERVEGEFVYTIEGNTSDSVARRRYRLDSGSVMGFGVPWYVN